MRSRLSIKIVGGRRIFLRDLDTSPDFRGAIRIALESHYVPGVTRATVTKSTRALSFNQEGYRPKLWETWADTDSINVTVAIYFQRRLLYLAPQRLVTYANSARKW